ncbi:hypothetical protein IGI37_000198 [Enterococcus sp. AZ194]|uniref:hypothetical protein n=1 Tax=Enterococcus sp. AZ194 TaxID=2774629 RepID=UPI003F212DD2
MGKTLFKTLTVLAAGIGAVAVCFFGYRANNQRQYQQRVEYAQAAITREKDGISKVETEVKGLFTDDKQVFLKPSVNEDTLTKLSGSLSAIKVSAKEFGIEEKALPDGAKGIQERKKVVENTVKDARAKLSIQQEASKLFVNGVSNWQKSENNVIIKENLKDTDVGRIRENLGLFDDSSWKKNVEEYLGYADAQVKRLSDLQKTFATMLKNDVVTNSVTYEGYLATVDSISQVRNEKEKAKYTALAEKVATQMGYGTSTNYYGETTNNSEIDTSETDTGY